MSNHNTKGNTMNMETEAIEAIEAMAEADAIDWDKVPAEVIATLHKIGVDESVMPEREYRVTVEFSGNIEVTVFAKSDSEAEDKAREAINVYDGVDSMLGNVEGVEYLDSYLENYYMTADLA